MSCQSNFKQKELSVCFQIDTLLRGDAPNPCCSSRISFPKEIMSTSTTSISPMTSPKYASTLYGFSARISFFFNFIIGISYFLLYKLFVDSKYWCDWQGKTLLTQQKITIQSHVFGTTSWSLASNSRSCHAPLRVGDMKSCNVLGQVLIHVFFFFCPYSLAWQQTPSAPHHNEQLLLCAAIRAVKESKISHAISAHDDFVHLRFGAKRSIWQTFLPGLQLLSCRVSCRRFDRFHFTLSHWQRCYKQVQITTKYTKVEKKKTATEERLAGLRYRNSHWQHPDR